jgi:hypothetical protein
MFGDSVINSVEFKCDTLGIGFSWNWDVVTRCCTAGDDAAGPIEPQHRRA